MVPRVGQRIGPYEILGRLGSGGMGLVYSAWDVRLQRDVAIKLLREEFLTPAMRSRFLQEARAASRLNHPNICTIFDIGEQQGDPYMVMELLKGETIRQRMTRGAMSVEDILSLAIDVADALVVAHAQGVVHRDIKPANIILVEKPGGGFQTKVLDFGLAKVDSGGLSGESRFDLTSIGTTVGTVSYMSPEQARGESLDARSDLFSLGVVLYEMSTGQLPFRGATSALVFVQLLSHRPDPVREFNAEIPRDLERVINRLLEKGRNDRFQSARELVQALQQVFLKKTAAARPSWSQVLLGRKPELPGGAPKLDPSPASPGTARPLDASPPPVSQSSESVLRPVKRILPRPDSLPPGPSPVSAHSEPPASPPSVPPSAGPAPAPSRFSAPPASRPSGYEPEEEPIEATSLPRLVAPGGRLLQRRPLRRFDPGDRDDYQRLLPDSRSGDFSDPRVARSHRALWTALSAALGVALLALMVWYFINHRPAEGGPEANSLALGPIANHSGDVGLGAAILTGLRLDLQQSTELSIRGPADFSSGLTLAGLRGDAISGDSLSVEDARRAARNIAAAQFLLGDVRNTGVGFATSIRVYDADTGNKIADVTESASTREQIPGSIDRLAADLRSALGESSDSIARTAVPLDREASSNLDALEGYAKAQSLMSAGHVVDAISTLQQVILLEPHFTAARLLLTEIFRRQHAEVAAAKSAADAVTSAAAACQRTQWLAQASYDINSIGDYGQAVQVLQQITRDYPGDLEAERLISLAQRLSGKYPESLDTAGEVLKNSPFDDVATGEAELAMIALDRADAADQMEQQSEAAGRIHPGIDVMVDFLGSGAENSLSPDLTTIPDRYAPLEYAAAVLDARGQMEAGLVAWRNIANRARSIPDLVSAGAFGLSQAALNRALTGDCSTAEDLLHTAQDLSPGPAANQAIGTAAALCGTLDDTRKALAALNASPAQNFATHGIYIPTLTALLQWKTGDPDAALATLQSVKQNDLISLTPYLRGAIHLSANQGQLAIVDFQSMLLHRGATTLIDAEAYPLAQLGLARAYLAAGDKTNSKLAYAKFLTQWSAADPSSPLLAEARAHAH